MYSIVSFLGAKILFADFAPPFRFSRPLSTIRFVQCLSFRIRHSFELIATERIAEFVPFRMETRAWPALTWGQLNIAIPIKARFTFWFYKGLCKQNVSLHGGVSHFTALKNSIRAVGLKITKTTPGGLATSFDLAVFRLSMIALVENLSIIREL